MGPMNGTLALVAAGSLVGIAGYSYGVACALLVLTACLFTALALMMKEFDQ